MHRNGPANPCSTYAESLMYNSVPLFYQGVKPMNQRHFGIAITRNKKTMLATVVIGVLLCSGGIAEGETMRLESSSLLVEVDTASGDWSLLDKQANVTWPSKGTAGPGVGEGLGGTFDEAERSARWVRLIRNGVSVTFKLVNSGRGVEITYSGEGLSEIRVLKDALAVESDENGYAIVPCREGLLIPADSGVAFERTFGTSEYEGCHLNMLGFVKRGAALVLTWDDAYLWPQLKSTVTNGNTDGQRLSTELTLRRTARTFRLTPLGPGDWNTIAKGYRDIARQKGFVVTLREKIRHDRHLRLMLGASNVKLWQCLARRMNEESTEEEWVRVNWTFDEAAAIAEHLHDDLDIASCFFMIGGWTESGYDCRHPDNLPANPECGGNEALADAIQRIQKLDYVACLHDNYQDMYRDAKSWDPKYIAKKPDGSLVQGGRWLGGRAYIVCPAKRVELAMRPQNLPETERLFHPWSYFIDTTYAAGPRECFDPNHPIDRNDDIEWKIRLSDQAREIFGIFGSECGREWALPHSDFFEGLVGVSGRYYHNLKPEELGAQPIPFWEMVYHDCQICYGKYGYRANEAAEYVAHHVLAARPLHYHSLPHHLYWKEKPAEQEPKGERACFMRTDDGWAEGFHPADVFLKNTHEVLGPLHYATAHDRLTQLEFLTADRSVRRARYGEGRDTTIVVVNFGPEDVSVESRWGGEVMLPSWGFVVDSPRFAAFYAKRWNGRDYPAGALFTIQSVEGKNLRSAKKLRVFHGFGDPTIVWEGAAHRIPREEVIEVAR